MPLCAGSPLNRYISYRRCTSKSLCISRTCMLQSTLCCSWLCIELFVELHFSCAVDAVYIGVSLYWLLRLLVSIFWSRLWCYTPLKHLYLISILFCYSFLEYFFWCSSITTSTIIIFARGCIPRTTASATTTDGASARARTPLSGCASHDDGNYFLYVSVDTVIRGLSHSHCPARPRSTYPREVQLLD